MRLLLDTSVAIALRDGDPLIKARAARLEPVALLSIISVVELEGGVASASVDRDKRRSALDAMYETLDVLAFGWQEGQAYSRIVEQLGFARRLVIDRMIAAQSIVCGATLATLNIRDVRQIAGLSIEDWSAPFA